MALLESYQFTPTDRHSAIREGLILLKSFHARHPRSSDQMT